MKINTLNPPKTYFQKWFKLNGRDFPWRQNHVSPFEILITEMLLRQTRASAVAQIWLDISTACKSPERILETPHDKIRASLLVLGFGNQKAEALVLASKWILEHHDGQVPAELEELLLIPHIGLYSARAIMCFAFGKKIEIVDTNVLRFFSRYYGLSLKPDIRRAPQAWSIAASLLPRQANAAREHNYGLLDFTADICKPVTPDCGRCSLSGNCIWFKEHK